MLPGLREVFAIPATFALSEVGIALGLALSAVILMEVTKLLLVNYQQPELNAQLNRS
ncbi:hypothetical protein GCM10019993_23110 [Enterococcus pseudoavium]